MNNSISFVPGQCNPAGFDINGDGQADITLHDLRF